MTIVLYGLATFAVIFGGGMLGLLLGRVLPAEYHSDATQKIVQTATGLISLLAALALGLLVATAKNKFDTSNQEVEKFAASLILLNRELVNYDRKRTTLRLCFANTQSPRLKKLGRADLDPSQDPTIPRLGSCLKVCSRV
jgi:hypothetical protein